MFNVKNGDRNTPLHIACKNGNTSIVKELLDSGAYVNRKGCNGDTPLSIAHERDYDEIIQLLLKK